MGPFFYTLDWQRKLFCKNLFSHHFSTPLSFIFNLQPIMPFRLFFISLTKKSDIKTKAMKQLLLLFFLSLFMPLSNRAQEAKKTTLFLDAGHQIGYFLKSNNFVSGKNKLEKPLNNYNAFNLRLGFQTNGTQEWARIHHLPYYGIGLYLPFLPDRDELGTPVAVYGFFGAPLIRRGNLALVYEGNFGFSYGWKGYQQSSNPYNIVIGTDWSFYIGINGALEYQISNNFLVQLGVGFLHFSNGSLRMPNQGFNLATAPYLTLRHYLQPHTQKKELITAPFTTPISEWFITASAGVREVIRDTAYTHLPDYYIDRQFLVSGLSAGWQKQFARKWKYVLGVDLNYDQVMNSLIEADEAGEPELLNKKFTDKLYAGCFVGGEMLVDRFALFLHMGYTVWQNDQIGRPETNYQRLGLKYYTKRLFYGLHLRIRDYGKADYIQAAVGVRL